MKARHRATMTGRILIFLFHCFLLMFRARCDRWRWFYVTGALRETSIRFLYRKPLIKAPGLFSQREKERKKESAYVSEEAVDPIREIYWSSKKCLENIFW